MIPKYSSRAVRPAQPSDGTVVSRTPGVCRNKCGAARGYLAGTASLTSEIRSLDHPYKKYEIRRTSNRASPRAGTPVGLTVRILVFVESYFNC